MPLPLLLFDCDGTLVDSEPLLAEEMSIGLNSVGLPFSPSDYLGEFRGSRFRNIVARLQASHGEVGIDQLNSMETTMRANLTKRLAQELTTIPGAKEALQQLSAYPSAVVSNGPEAKIRTALQATGLDSYFAERLFSGYTANCWKPEPCLHLYAASIMGFNPAHCIAIDDALVGVRAALEAGMKVIHLNRFPDAETTPENAIMISNMFQLPAVVRQLSQEVSPSTEPYYSEGK
ncbi:HAD family hydrolase [Vreelandella arcis]|uniref:Haloacid dehalogenase superfamily, subfamily IA, variant 3 with third motif having DD or ED n=1 Tax=Vreelandella arcis TaxID=416873 RepID=A0A1H0JS02_9GAMM|nr:HAD-IA family hydrolase [Halomonas arcis]SDO46575.1 haloacid dehalogenase superfamily, subfamily IA, variant 3 with third motif having DD or ED [Halomonas arcis]